MAGSDQNQAMSSGAERRPAQVLVVPFAKKVFRFDSRIRYFSVVNTQGEEIFSASRPNLVSLEPEEETRRLFAQIVLIRAILEGENRYHGRTTGAILLREKVTLLTFAGIDRIYFFSAEPDFPLSKVEKLGKLLDTISIE
jgi:hypothetical protein